jgi:hypothetical protein
MISDTLAAGIARNLDEFGYSGVTKDEVLAELALPESSRSIIGMMAAGMLEDNGLDPQGNRLTP